MSFELTSAERELLLDVLNDRTNGLLPRMMPPATVQMLLLTWSVTRMELFFAANASEK